MTRAVARLFTLYISSILAVGMAAYYGWLDLLISVIFLALFAMEARHQATLLPHWTQRIAVIALVQLPGIALITGSLLHLERYFPWVWYAQFTLEIWDMPVLPLISLIPAAPAWLTPPYYYALFMAVPLLCLFYLLCQFKAELT